MEQDVYRFSVIDRDTDKVICTDISDVTKLRKYLPKTLYHYLYSEVVSKRLVAKRLTEFNRTCIVNYIKVSKDSSRRKQV